MRIEGTCDAAAKPHTPAARCMKRHALAAAYLFAVCWHDAVPPVATLEPRLGMTQFARICHSIHKMKYLSRGLYLAAIASPTLCRTL